MVSINNLHEWPTEINDETELILLRQLVHKAVLGELDDDKNFDSNMCDRDTEQ